jgi:hypothetical protein
MAEPQFAVLLSRQPGATEWSIRNNRLSFSQEIMKRAGATIDDAMKEGQRQILGWTAVEPLTEFKLVKVPYGHELLVR